MLKRITAKKAATHLLYLIRWSTAHSCNWYIWWWCNSTWHVATTTATQRTAWRIEAVSCCTAGCHNRTMAATKSDWGGAGSQFQAECPGLLMVLSMPRWRDNRTVMWWHGRGTVLLGQGHGRAAWPWRKLRRNLWCSNTSANCWKIKSNYILVRNSVTVWSNQTASLNGTILGKTDFKKSFLLKKINFCYSSYSHWDNWQTPERHKTQTILRITV
jgi:hypothetical protein